MPHIQWAAMFWKNISRKETSPHPRDIFLLATGVMASGRGSARMMFVTKADRHRSSVSQYIRSLFVPKYTFFCYVRMILPFYRVTKIPYMTYYDVLQ